MRKLTRILLATAISMLMLTLFCFEASALEDVCEHSSLSQDADYYIGDCTLGGELHYYCDFCFEEIFVTVEPKEHNLEDYEEPDSSTFCGTQTIYIPCNDCSSLVTMTIEGTQKHEWEPDFMSPTDVINNCNEGGKLPYYCCYCDSTREEYIAPQEHSIDWIFNNDATCTKDATKTAYCGMCHEGFFNKLETVPVEGTALGHNYNEEWTVLLPATCTDRGVQITTCTRCSDIKSEILPATGHTDNNNDNICDECNAKLSDATVPDDTNPDEGTTDTPETPDEPTEPEEPKKEANVFSFLTDFLNNIIDFFKKLFKL